jgi:hypothetical protein
LQRLVDRAAETPLAHGIAEIEALTQGGDLVMVEYAGEQESFLLPLLPNASKVGTEVPVSQLRRIVDHVRDAVLEWVLQLDRAGVAGSGVSFTEKEKEQAASVTPPIQNFFYGELRQVQIQQGSPGSAQSMTVGDLQGVAELVKALRESLDDMRFADGERGELEKNVEVLEREIKSSRPATWAIRTALSGIWTLGSGVASSYIATKYGIQIEQLIRSFMP